MFFEIKQCKDDTYTNSYPLSNNYWLNCDAGWYQYHLDGAHVFIKGYLDHYKIDRNLIRQIIHNPSPKFHGNFVAIISDNNKILITHDINRSCPIRIDEKSNIIHNMNKPYSRSVWADQTVMLGQTLEYTSFDPIGNLDLSTQSWEYVLDRIDSILADRIINFTKHNQLPIKFFPSGGIDTFLLLSYLNKFNIDYELCDYEHMDLTKFICLHKDDFQKNWAYRQIHHWRSPCILATGGNGDENFLRGPFASNLLCMYYGVDIQSILKPSDYHYSYFLSSKNKELYSKQQKDKFFQALIKDKQKLFTYIANNILNDHQHWHLENTLTFTPFKDIEITKLILQLDIKDLVRQFNNADINRELIKRNDEQLLGYISSQKNLLEKENVWKLFEQETV